MIPIRPRGGASPRSSRQAVAAALSSRVVPKPVPERETKDARGYQIEQLRRRYNPQETVLDNGETSLFFHLKPSDPDFPYDLDYLECDLRIPEAYPKEAPRLRVKNKNIPRGFAINIEKGWDALVQEKRGATLLSLTNALDRRLESFLSEQKAETVKLTIFKDTRHLSNEPAAEPAPQPSKPVLNAPVSRSYVPEDSFSEDRIAEAKARRAQDVRQLEARMSRLPVYQKSSDGIVYTLSLEPKRRSILPAGLQSIQSVQLIIPLLYPLQPLRILFNDVDSEVAEPIEELFVQKAAEQKHMSLTSHLNYLAQNLHILAKEAQKPPVEAAEGPETQAVPSQEAEHAEHTATLDRGKGHIQVIPRPPEWDSHDSADDSDSEDGSYAEEGEDGGADTEPQQAQQSEAGSSQPTQTPERGTAILFPSIELYGVELLQISVLNLNVKCDRCKTVNELTGLRDNIEKTSSCQKCAIPFSARFRQELIHQNSSRAGFIDAVGCTVSDLLPSTFTPTCAACSTPSPAGLTSVRGETTTNVCRECHARFTFALPDVKFLAHRWFRFSCCSKVYPCDRCHDAAEAHANEWASRMICGWCSREQRYSPESCAFCGRSVIGNRGKGYWEGGKGTRDPLLMRRGDKRKYKRLGALKKEN
ncbi:hypothetical protein VTH06DRAFT_7735 [Thermothelomyces fergusii]